MTDSQIYTAATTTAITTSVCSKCGAIQKSGKTSCCGRGGSWFRNCGSAGNSKYDHTWSEGIRACNSLAQSKTAIDQGLTTIIPTAVNRSSPMPMVTLVDTPLMALANAPVTKLDDISINTSVHTLINTSFHTSTANASTEISSLPSHIRSLPDTIAATAILTSANKTIITHTAKEAAGTTNWIAQGVCYAICLNIL